MEIDSPKLLYKSVLSVRDRIRLPVYVNCHPVINYGVAKADNSSCWDIAQLAKEADVSSRTIRYYGELGLLCADSRGANGRRLYSEDALERLRFIVRLKKIGLTLEQIGELNHTFDRSQTPGMLERLDQMLTTRLTETEARLNELSQLQQDLLSYRHRIQQKRADH